LLLFFAQPALPCFSVVLSPVSYFLSYGSPIQKVLAYACFQVFSLCFSLIA
jgi:hypothetical protein